MYLSKKTKLILVTAVPATIIAVPAVVVSSLLILNEQQTKKVLNNSVNKEFTFNTKNEIENLMSKSDLQYNPYDFTKLFFVQKIANSNILINNENKIEKVSAISQILKPTDITDVNGIKYEVESVRIDENNKVVANVKKSLNGITIKYSTTLNENNVFQDEETSMSNFVKTIFDQTAKEFNVEENKIKSSQDFSTNPTPSLGSLSLEGKGFVKEDNVYSKDSFSYPNSLTEKFSSVDLEISQVWDNSNTGITAFEAKINELHTAGKLYGTVTENLGTQYNKYFYPVLLKFSLGETTSQPDSKNSGAIEKYMVVWQNIYSLSSNNIVSDSADIQLTTFKITDPVTKLERLPSLAEVEKDYETLLQFTTLPSNSSLKYKIINLAKGETSGSLKATINVSSPETSTTRDYEVTLDSTKFTSEEQIAFDHEVYNILSANGTTEKLDFDLVKPTAAFITTSEYYGQEIPQIAYMVEEWIQNNDWTKMDSLIKLTPQASNGDKIKFIPVSSLWESIGSTNQLVINYKMVSAQDDNIESSYNNIELVTVVLTKS